MTRPRLLDLFCCEGGAGVGYDRAGFDVTGVDLMNHAARYPFKFHRGDALRYIERHGGEFDAVHASPPCQAHTDLKHLHQEDLSLMLMPMPKHLDLIPETRAALVALGKPWVMENVEGSTLTDPVILCGSMFMLGAQCVDGQWRQLRRHRLFESNIALSAPGACAHKGQPVGVYGHGGGGPLASIRGYKGTKDESNQALGTPWMSRKGVSQAIPPAYTEHLGAQLLAVL